VLPPALDGRFVPLGSTSLRLLLGEAERVQDTTNVVAVVLHAKPLANHLRHATTSPQVGAKAGGQGAVANNLGQLLLLFGRQPGRTASIRLGSQGFAAAQGCCTFPTLAARHVDADEFRDLSVALPIQ